MSPDTAQLILVVVTVFGAIGVAILGWAESGDPFDARKFASSVGRAVTAGLLSSLVFQGVTEIDTFTVVLALLTGAGIDVIGNRGAGALRTITGNTDKKTPPTSEDDNNE